MVLGRGLFLISEVHLSALFRHSLGGAYVAAVLVLRKVCLISVQVTLQEGADPPHQNHHRAQSVSRLVPPWGGGGALPEERVHGGASLIRNGPSP